MNPGAGDADFWAHIPNWAWPIIIAGIVGFFAYQLIKASETVAHTFGTIGRHIHERAIAPRRTAKKVEHIEQILLQTSDSLECATAYLVTDAEYHHASDIIIAENCPGVFNLLPKRISFTEFSRRWKEEGWRP